MGRNLSTVGAFDMERLDIHRLDIPFFSLDCWCCNNAFPCPSTGTRRYKKDSSSANYETLIDYLRARSVSCWISLFQPFYNSNYGGSSANCSVLFRSIDSCHLYKECSRSIMLAGRVSRIVLADHEVPSCSRNWYRCFGKRKKFFSLHRFAAPLRTHVVANENMGSGRNCEHASRDSNYSFRRFGGALPSFAAFEGRKNGMDVHCRKHSSPRRYNVGYVAAD